MTEMTVTAMESYEGRIHIVGDRLYAVYDVWLPGFLKQKLDRVEYITIENGKFKTGIAKEGYTSELGKDVKPLIDLTGGGFRPRPEAGPMNVVNNLIQAHPELATYTGWQIDLAHRDWTQSEDQDDESKLINWIPADSPENKYRYMMMQIGDAKRGVQDLERYNADLHKQIGQLKSQLAAVKSGLAGS